jgi:hypothetical protein
MLPVLALVIFSSCATLNQAEIKSSAHYPIEKQCLDPILDFYGERIDLLRNKTEIRGGAGNEGTEDMPYHDAGFYLGNGLFYDLNGNLCLLPWKPFFKLENDFKIVKEVKSGLLNESLVFIKNDSSLTIETKKGIGFTKNYEFNVSDSVIIFNKGKLMNMEFHIKNNGDYFYKRALANEDIEKIKNGFSIKSFLNKDFYKIEENKITLANRAVIIYRDKMVEVFEQGWSKPKLKYQMVVVGNQIIIYDNKFRGYKLERENSMLKVFKNSKLITIYKKED